MSTSVIKVILILQQVDSKHIDTGIICRKWLEILYQWSSLFVIEIPIFTINDYEGYYEVKTQELQIMKW